MFPTKRLFTSLLPDFGAPLPRADVEQTATLVLELTASNRLKSDEEGSHGAHQGIQAIQRRKPDNITFAAICPPFLSANPENILLLCSTPCVRFPRCVR
jgi:hypothetical protein